MVASGTQRDPGSYWDRDGFCGHEVRAPDVWFAAGDSWKETTIRITRLITKFFRVKTCPIVENLIEFVFILDHLGPKSSLVAIGGWRCVGLSLWPLRNWRHGPVVALLVFQGTLTGTERKKMHQNAIYKNHWQPESSRIAWSFSAHDQSLLQEILWLYSVVLASLQGPCIEAGRLVRRKSPQCAESALVIKIYMPGTSNW